MSEAWIFTSLSCAGHGLLRHLSVARPAIPVYEEEAAPNVQGAAPPVRALLAHTSQRLDNGKIDQEKIKKSNVCRELELRDALSG